jgi:hypothetical protein
MVGLNNVYTLYGILFCRNDMIGMVNKDDTLGAGYFRATFESFFQLSRSI